MIKCGKSLSGVFKANDMKLNFLQRYFFYWWVAFGLTAGMGLGCSLIPIRPEVISQDSENEIYLTIPDSLEKPPWMETFVWTVKCEAGKGRTCEGSPVLSLPSDKALCRYNYQILQGPKGNTEQIIVVKNDSSLIVHIRAIGGPAWNPYKSRIMVQVRGVGLAKEADQETRKVLNCKPFS